MSYSLKLQHGDLSVESGSYETVQGSAKVAQDMQCWILEPTVTDPMHPSFGSVIDGGYLPNGKYIDSPIGNTDQDQVARMVEGELRRIINLYKSQQLARIRQDQLTYGRTTILASEVIRNIESINTLMYADGIFVEVKLSTLDGQSVSLSFPLGG